MFKGNETIAGFDDELMAAIRGEELRQEEHIELIASENYASPRVLEAQGTVLTNKYAEGYPGKRYYGGCEYVDVVEVLAIERAKQLFGADFANVQPHSGSQANAAVYQALLQPHDTVLGMSLSDGGRHFTHAVVQRRGLKHILLQKFGHDIVQFDGFVQCRIRAAHIGPNLHQIATFLVARINRPKPPSHLKMLS